MLYNRGSTYIRNTPGKIPADVAVTDTRSSFSSSTYDDSNSGIDGLETGGYANTTIVHFDSQDYVFQCNPFVYSCSVSKI